MANHGLSCFSCLCSCLIVVINIFVFVIGLITLALGVLIKFGLNWIKANASVESILEPTQKLLREQLKTDIDIIQFISNSIVGSAGVALLLIGSVMIVVAFISWCGACCKVKPCLIIYAVLTGLFFLAEVTVVIIWYADANVLKSGTKEAMVTSLRRYRGPSNPNAETLLQDMAQAFIGCCGVNNGSDYGTINTQWERSYNLSTGTGQSLQINLTYPITCCRLNLGTFKPINPLCPLNNADSNKDVGCFAKVFNYAEVYFLNYLFSVQIGVLLLQLLLFAGAIVIYCANVEDKPYPRKPRINRVEPQW